MVTPSVPPSAPSEAAGVGARRTRFRWTICALVFFAVTINYIDRLVFGILAPELQ